MNVGNSRRINFYHLPGITSTYSKIRPHLYVLHAWLHVGKISWLSLKRLLLPSRQNIMKQNLKFQIKGIFAQVECNWSFGIHMIKCSSQSEGFREAWILPSMFQWRMVVFYPSNTTIRRDFVKNRQVSKNILAWALTETGLELSPVTESPVKEVHLDRLTYSIPCGFQSRTDLKSISTLPVSSYPQNYAGTLTNDFELPVLEEQLHRLGFWALKSY